VTPRTRKGLNSGRDSASSTEQPGAPGFGEVQHDGARPRGRIARAERIRKVDELIGLQLGSAAIARKLAADYGISERMAYKDIREAFARLEANDAEDRGMRRARMRHTLQMLFRRCLSRKDYRGAGFAVDRLCRLDGLYEPEAIHVTQGASEELPDLSVLSEEMRELLRKQLESASPDGDLRTLAGPMFDHRRVSK
jgi:hypothetical protein